MKKKNFLVCLLFTLMALYLSPSAKASNTSSNFLNGPLFGMGGGWLCVEQVLNKADEMLDILSTVSHSHLQTRVFLGWGLNMDDFLMNFLFSLDYSSFPAGDLGDKDNQKTVYSIYTNGLDSIRYGLGMDLGYVYNKIAPFLSAGAAFVNPREVDAGAIFDTNNFLKVISPFGFYAGGGFSYIINENLSVRLETRYVKFFASKDLTNRESEVGKNVYDKVKLYRFLKRGINYVDTTFALIYTF